jgi:hypothetical protein
VLAATIGTFAVLAVPAAAGAMTSDHCHCTTTTSAPTTTTEVTTTTVAAVTTIVSSTTVPRETSTTVHEQIVTTTTAPASTTGPPPSSPTSVRMSTTVPGQHLPFTGGSVLFPSLFGLCCLAGGAALLFRRSGWRASS